MLEHMLCWYLFVLFLVLCIVVVIVVLFVVILLSLLPLFLDVSTTTCCVRLTSFDSFSLFGGLFFLLLSFPYMFSFEFCWLCC